MQLEMFSLTPYPLKGGPKYLYLKKTKVGLRLTEDRVLPLNPNGSTFSLSAMCDSSPSRGLKSLLKKNQSWA